MISSLLVYRKKKVKDNFDIKMDQFESFPVREVKLTKQKLDFVSEKKHTFLYYNIEQNNILFRS